MTNEEIFTRLQNIFRDIFDNDSLLITRNTIAADIEDWDSLAQINLVVASEKEFKVKFTLKDMASLNNVGDMLDLIAREVK